MRWLVFIGTARSAEQRSEHAVNLENADPRGDWGLCLTKFRGALERANAYVIVDADTEEEALEASAGCMLRRDA
jgi:uncharacterized protein (DUF2237 family)